MSRTGRRGTSPRPPATPLRGRLPGRPGSGPLARHPRTTVPARRAGQAPDHAAVSPVAATPQVLPPLSARVGGRARGHGGASRHLARHVGRIAARRSPGFAADTAAGRSTTAGTCTCGRATSRRRAGRARPSWCGSSGAGRAQADRVLTVNASYARLLADQLRIPAAAGRHELPGALEPPDPRPDLIRESLGLAPRRPSCCTRAG